MTTVVRVRGENGWEFEQDVPAEGTSAREVFDDSIRKGVFVVLGEFIPEFDEDGVPVTKSERRDGVLVTGVNVGEFIEKAWPFDGDVEVDESDDSGDRPAKSASKAKWVDFAVSEGVDRDVAEAYSKDELFVLFNEAA